MTLFVQLYESNTAAVKSEIATFFAFPNAGVGQHEQRPGLRPRADQVEPTKIDLMRWRRR